MCPRSGSTKCQAARCRPYTSVDRMRLIRALVCMTGLAAPLPGWAQGGGPAGSGVLSGHIIDRDGGQPVPFGTVLMGDGRGTFANDQGAFRLSGLAPGRYAVRARQIGYAPVDTTVAISGTAEPTTVVFRLRRLAFSLARIRVQGQENGCVPAPSPAVAQGTPLGMVLAQVRENVDRLRLLLDEYPFRYR